MIILLPYRRITLSTYQTPQEIRDNIMRKRYLDDWRYFRYECDETHHQFEGLLQTTDWWFRLWGWVSVKMRGDVHDNLNMRLISLIFYPGPLLIAALVVTIFSGIMFYVARSTSVFVAYILVALMSYLALVYWFHKAANEVLEHIREFTEARLYIGTPPPFNQARPANETEV